MLRELRAAPRTSSSRLSQTGLLQPPFAAPGMAAESYCQLPRVTMRMAITSGPIDDTLPVTFEDARDTVVAARQLWSGFGTLALDRRTVTREIAPRLPDLFGPKPMARLRNIVPNFVPH